MCVRLGTWNVRSLYRAALLKTLASEMAKCNLDLVADGLRLVASQQTIRYFSMRKV
jgi:hypothetical protein